MKPYGQEARWHVDSDYATKDVRSYKRRSRQQGKAEVMAEYPPEPPGHIGGAVILNAAKD